VQPLYLLYELCSSLLNAKRALHVFKKDSYSFTSPSATVIPDNSGITREEPRASRPSMQLRS
jgi:hypothetical protein